MEEKHLAKEGLKMTMNPIIFMLVNFAWQVLLEI